MGQDIGIGIIRIPKNYRNYRKSVIICEYCKNELSWNDKYYRFEINDVPSKLKTSYNFLIDIPFCTFNCACKYLVTKRKEDEIITDIPSELFLEYGDPLTHYRFSSTFRTALKSYNLYTITDNFDLFLISKERTESFCDGQIVLPVVGYTEKKTNRSSWLTSDGVICVHCKTKIPLNKTIYWSYSKKLPFCNLHCAYNYIISSSELKYHCESSQDKTLALYYGSIKSMLVNDSVFNTMLIDLDYVFCVNKLCKDAIKTSTKTYKKYVNEVEFYILRIGYQYR